MILVNRINQDIILHIATGEYKDGKEVYASIPAKGLMTSATTKDLAFWGNIQSNKIMLVSVQKKLILPLQIEFQGQIYDVKQLRECRTLDGDVVAYRCLL
jgi:hypothetical protein